MKSKKYLTDELVNRSSQFSFFKYIGMLPNPDRVLRRTGKTIDAYRDLKNDPHVWSCIQSRKSGVIALDYEIVSGGASASVASEISKIFDNLDVRAIIREALEAPLFGYQPFEIMWERATNSRFSLKPAAVVGKPQEWFFYDGDGNLKYKSAANPKGETPPPMKIVVARYEASYLNPYGEALLSKCYWPLTFKNGGLRFWVNFMEKYGMPILLGSYSRGATTDEAQKLADELSEMTEDAVIVAPSDVELTLHEAARSSSVELYRELVRLCNAEISKALLSQTLTTEIATGSYAAAETHFKVRREVVESDARLVESFFDEIIRHIVSLNFHGSPPRFRFKLPDDDGD